MQVDREGTLNGSAPREGSITVRKVMSPLGGKEVKLRQLTLAIAYMVAPSLTTGRTGDKFTLRPGEG
jgi:hypothetical protein